MSQPEPNVDEVVRSIAEETDTPTETVSKMYADTLADYRHEARVFDYVPLFAAKKVRDKLRHTSKPTNTDTAARGDHRLLVAPWIDPAGMRGDSPKRVPIYFSPLLERVFIFPTARL